MIASIKYPGAKWSYAEWITSFIPPHKFYLEPFFGSGAIYFNKLPVKYETINDIDGLVVNFFKVCRDFPEDLARAINLTPFARDEFMAIQEGHSGEDIKLTGDCIEDARRFAIRCAQSFGSRTSDRCGWKNTKHAAGPVCPAIWSKLPETIMEIAARLKNAQIENADAVSLIKAYNASDCLIYADPPYLAETRQNKRIYKCEMMGADEHKTLLTALLEHTGPVILSGYDNGLYNDMLRGWHKEQKQGWANSAEARTETIWMNFDYQIRLI